MHFLKTQASSRRALPVIGHTLPQVASHCFSLRKWAMPSLAKVGRPRFESKDFALLTGAPSSVLAPSSDALCS